ncbi:winged helix-turn-helix domain-containing protein [Vibrio sp. MA40-2]|uniref:winged helix-turn-helix domain-containing protein n=1 Tax=Vibrio sp. MA40-2 TaxID=3391828 RepID=UPI0039A4561F
MSSIGTKFILAQRFVFDPNSDSLVDKTNSNELNRLGSNESRILLLFSKRPSQIITRDELHDFVWREQGFQVDDSSLTQAISTLRKVLCDSTKTPQFIKTVPKRGYQFIASVEKTVPLLSSLNEGKITGIAKDISSTNMVWPNTSENLPKANVEKSNISSDLPESKAVELCRENEQTATEQDHYVSSKINVQNNKRTHHIGHRLIFFIAILLPLLVYLSMEPASSKFKLIDTIDGIPLQTTERHPPLEHWQPLFNKCVQAYLSEVNSTTFDQKPTKIIITAGPNNNLIINYVHSESNTADNVTIQLFTKRYNANALCNEPER